MNKAFMKEPESDGKAYCPSCGSLGDAVLAVTLDYHLRPDARSQLGQSAFFCPYSDCEVAYFDEYHRFVTVEQLNVAIYPKSIDAPICPCFGFSQEDLDEAIASRSPESLRSIFVKSKTADAKCSTVSANGKCCLTELQRLYVRGTAND